MKHWWKVLGIILLIYSFIAGMIVPLKTGIYKSTPFVLKAGEVNELEVWGYNSFYTNAKSPVRAWLKLDSIHAVIASEVEVVSDNQLKAKFTLPANFPTLKKAASLSLIVDNDADGATVLPDAVTVTMKKENNSNLLDPAWRSAPIERLSSSSGVHYPYRNVLGETIRNTFYHVPFWFAMMIIFAVSMVYSWRYLSTMNIDFDHKAKAFAQVGVLYGILGLATGSLWARFTWGDWWSFDIKQNMAAVSMLIYLAFFVLRSSFDDEEKKARISNVYNIFAFSTLIPLLFVIPRLVDSLHPGSGGNPGFGGDDLDNTMRMVLYPAVFGWLFLGIWLANISFRLSRIKSRFYLDF